jgi:hypothetical protein
VDKMRRLISGDQSFLKPCKRELITDPFATSWKELLEMLLAK